MAPGFVACVLIVGMALHHKLCHALRSFDLPPRGNAYRHLCIRRINARLSLM
jgi:hypothetical protein